MRPRRRPARHSGKEPWRRIGFTEKKRGNGQETPLEDGTFFVVEGKMKQEEPAEDSAGSIEKRYEKNGMAVLEINFLAIVDGGK